MARIVMKFGGSSVGTIERIQKVAERIVQVKSQGNQCVIVVSAMGDTTDNLIDMAKQLSSNLPAREMDMLLTTGEQTSTALLSIAIQSLGQSAISLTGWQAGMKTNAQHGNARISDIQPERILRALEEDNVVIIAGFQGLSPDGEITTLGRGGSDTTAVAIAASIEADLCEIFTDVDGVYSTDPRIVRVASKLSEISYDEMLELAHLGSAVLHPRAVEYAKLYQVRLVVRSSFNYNEGTQVKEATAMEQGVVVRGIAYDKNVARISILGVDDKPGILARVFTELANEHINVDIIVQSGVLGSKADFSFTVTLEDKDKALHVINRIRPEVTYDEVTSEIELVKVSIVGAGMVSNPGVAARMFEIISRTGVSIKMVSTSDIKVSCVVELSKLKEVIAALHSEFGLDSSEEVFVGGPKDRR